MTPTVDDFEKIPEVEGEFFGSVAKRLKSLSATGSRNRAIHKARKRSIFLLYKPL